MKTINFLLKKSAVLLVILTLWGTSVYFGAFGVHEIYLFVAKSCSETTTHILMFLIGTGYLLIEVLPVFKVMTLAEEIKDYKVLVH